MMAKPNLAMRSASHWVYIRDEDEGQQHQIFALDEITICADLNFPSSGSFIYGIYSICILMMPAKKEI